jgi:hypothetical protein
MKASLRPSTVPRWCLLAVALHAIGLVENRSVSAYITSYGAVPAKRQEAWLQELTVDLIRSKPGELTADKVSQGHDIMYAWSHTRTPPPQSPRVSAYAAPLAMESLVKRLVEERMAGNDVADVTTADYNCVLEGWARSGAGVFAAERVEQILQAMQDQPSETQKPNLSSFKAVLMAWRQQAGLDYAPYRSQRILSWMVELYQQGRNDKALPDADCFDIVLQTWGRSTHEQAPKNAEQVLFAMERLYESTKLERLKPRTTSFNAVLAAWSKSSQPQAAERASDVLAFMERLAYRDGDWQVAPDAASYATVMGALARHASQAIAAQKADEILQHAMEGSQSLPAKQHLVLDAILFNTAMGCWAKAGVPGAYRKARAILDQQITLYESTGNDVSKPDVYGYTSVIASCAAEKDPTEKANAFQVALQTFQQLPQHDEPNHVTYGTMLKAIAKLLPPNSNLRRQWTRRVFDQCCDAGCVGDMVIARLREAASPDVFKSLLQGHSKKSLPSSWTRRVEEKSDPRRKKTSKRPAHQHHRRKRAEV